MASREENMAVTVSEVERRKLPPGVRFHPTDEELVLYYLRKKITNTPCLNLAIIAEIDIYKFDPEDLPGQSVLKNGDKKWYFFCRRERKYSKGSRASQQTAGGYWKITGRDKSITYKSQLVGSKKTLVFYRGRAPSATRTDWVIQEYNLDQRELGNVPEADKDSYVLCKFYKKDGSGPMHPNDFGASYDDENWDNDVNFVEDNETNRAKLVRLLNGSAALDISSVHNHCHNPTYGGEEVPMDIEETPLVNQSHDNNSHAGLPLGEKHFVGLQPIQRKINENEGTIFYVEIRADELQKKIDAMQKDLDEKDSDLEYLQDLNRALLVKENLSNRELQEARKECIFGLRDCFSISQGIGLKQIGEIDKAPFMKVCFEKFSPQEWEEKAVDLLSYWQHQIADPEWHPFKRINLFGKMQEALDMNDEKLVMLHEEWGHEIYWAVVTSLREMNEHNGSGRYVCAELWNFDENRKADLKEVIQHIIQLLDDIKFFTKILIPWIYIELNPGFLC